MKLAILTSHPIQYQAPLFRSLAKQPEIDLVVYFNWNFGIKETYDPEFGKNIQWDIPLLEGYKYKFLKNYSLKPSSNFWGQINPGIIKELILKTSTVRGFQPLNITTREEVEPHQVAIWRGRTSNTNNNQYLRSPTSEASGVQKFKKYDAIIIFGWNSFTNWLAFLTAFVFKIPVLLRAENPLNQELLKPKWKIKIKKIILGWLFKQISAFLYIGEENKKFYQFYGVPENKLFFCPYAVDNERFMEASKELRMRKDELREKIGVGKDDTAILFVGKLTKKKRPFDLLKAYESILRTSDVHNIDNIDKGNFGTSDVQKLKLALLFVGDGPLKTQLEDYVRMSKLKNVCFVGFKNQSEISEFYTIADIFVLPSGPGETWGLVVNEAMCFSLPVIVSDIVGCVPDLVHHDENGFIFPLGDVKELSRCLLELVSDGEKRKRFGKKSFEIIQNYSYEKDIEGTLKVLSIKNI